MSIILINVGKKCGGVKMILNNKVLAKFSYTLAIFVFVLKQSEFVKVTEFFSVGVSCLYLIALLVALLSLCINSRIGKKEIIIESFLFVILGYNIVANSADIELLIIAYYIFVCRKLEIGDVLKSYFTGSALAWILVLFCWKIGILPDIARKDRSYLGFFYTTFAPNIFLSIVLSFVALKGYYLKLYHLAIIIIINQWLYIETKTKAVYFTIWLLLLLIFVVKILEKFNLNFYDNNKIKFIIKYSGIIFPTFTIVILKMYCDYSNTMFWRKVDILLSYRLSLSEIAFSKYCVTLLGQIVNWETWTSETTTATSYLYVDSSYLQIILQYGVLLLIIVSLAMVLVSCHIANRKNMYIGIAVFLFLLHCVTDPQLLSFRYNPFLIMLLFSIKSLTKQSFKGKYREMV